MWYNLYENKKIKKVKKKDEVYVEYNVDEIRKDFKQLNEENIYLDTAATALKPKVVIDAMDEYYNKFNRKFS